MTQQAYDITARIWGDEGQSPESVVRDYQYVKVSELNIWKIEGVDADSITTPQGEQRKKNPAHIKDYLLMELQEAVMALEPMATDHTSFSPEDRKRMLAVIKAFWAGVTE